MDSIERFIEDLINFIEENSFEKRYSEILKNLCDSEIKLLFIGETNAGKSSLINAISGSEKCLVDSAPCTAKARAVDLSDTITLIDTPAIGSGIADYEAEVVHLYTEVSLIFAVLNARNPFSAKIWGTLADIKNVYHKKVAFVLQQSDLLKEDALNESISFVKRYAKEQGFDSSKIFICSTKNNVGVDEIRNFISSEPFGLTSDSVIVTVDGIVKQINSDMGEEVALLESRENIVSEIKRRVERIASVNESNIANYIGDYNCVLDNYDSDIKDLCNINAMKSKLTDPAEFKKHMDFIKYNLQNGAKQLLKSFNDSISSTGKRMSEQISDILRDKLALSKKDIYQKIELAELNIGSAVGNIDYGATINDEKFDDITQSIIETSGETIKKSRKTTVFIVLLPLIIFVLIKIALAIGGIGENTMSSLPLAEESGNLDLAALAKNIAGLAGDFTMEATAPIIEKFETVAVVITVVVLLIYAIIVFLIREAMLKRELFRIVLSKSKKFSDLRTEFKSQFAQRLRDNYEMIQSLYISIYLKAFELAEEKTGGIANTANEYDSLKKRWRKLSL